MRVDGIVEAEVAVLFADRAADGLNLAGERVDDMQADCSGWLL